MYTLNTFSHAGIITSARVSGTNLQLNPLTGVCVEVSVLGSTD